MFPNNLSSPTLQNPPSTFSPDQVNHSNEFDLFNCIFVDTIVI